MIVFGAPEREKAEAILRQLPPQLQRLYEETVTYRDGKWLKLTLGEDATIADVTKLLSIKRRPRPFS